MNILMTGGTGFIAQTLVPLLLTQQHQVTLWTRQTTPRLPPMVRWVNQLEDLPADTPYDAVINLAGAGIADQRWTPERKALLMSSRLETTQALVNWMREQTDPPHLLLSASAVGYYGEQGDRVLDEDTPPTAGFTHELCAKWEALAQSATSEKTRVVLVRTGVVLGQQGGALQKMLPAFQWGLGGRLGTGQQWFPWIHVQDMAQIYLWLLTQPNRQGPYNAAAPNLVRQGDFARVLGQVLRRPVWFPLPEKVLHLLLGEMAELLLVSSRMRPLRLEQEGFKFFYPELRAALVSLSA